MKHTFALSSLFIFLCMMLSPLSASAADLTRSFGLGASDATTGGEVTMLQRVLAQDPAIYPEGLVTGYFGPATERAVQRWQKSHNIVTSGTAATTGFGWVGPSTRVSINGYAAKPAAVAAPAPVSSVGSITRSFGLGASDATTGGEVTMLQRVLAQDPAIYPEGLVTGYFGPATERAVQRWQKSHNIVTSGTAATTGFGWVGPSTRVSINGYILSTMKTPTTTKTTFTSTTLTATAPVAKPDPRITGALSVTAAPNLVSTYQLSKAALLTNTISSSFVGTGNGLKVTFTQSGMPSGITPTATLSCVTPCSVENRVSIKPGMPEGVYPITVTALAGNEKAVGTYTVTIGEPTAYQFSLVPSGDIIVKKSTSGSVSGSNIIQLRTISGEPQAITLTQKSSDKYLTVKGLGTCLPPCQKTNSVTAGFDLPSGTYPVTITGAAPDGTTRSASYNVILTYNSKFGFHISNQEDPDRLITMTVPVGQPVTTTIPLQFLLDGGSPSYATVKVPTTLPAGVSASISGCQLPCSSTLTITLSPGILAGKKSVSFTAEAPYIDPVDNQQKILRKTYTEGINVIVGDLGL